MNGRAFRPTVFLGVLAGVAALTLPASAAAPPTPVVVQHGVVTRQDIPSQGASEPDTVVEPDVAVSPRNPDIAIAAAHDSRFVDGGAVTISAAWTADGGRTWHHQPIRGITQATGGPYERASDPVVAFGADGTAYLSVLPFDASSCPTAIAVLRSTDGGKTWSQPFYVHQSKQCQYSDDKNWLVVDNNASSPHFGRLYQFWTPFISTATSFVGSPQVVRWSDDKGTTWSATSYVTRRDHGTQNSQPMILPNGDIVDTYYDFGQGNQAPDAGPGASPEAAGGLAAAAAAPIDATGTVFASTSTDGGATWAVPAEVANNAGGFADGVRCCLFGADIDPITHRMFVAFEGGVGDTDPVYASWSDDGAQWSSPVRVSRGDVSGVQQVNVDVVAYHGRVFVSYGTRTHPENSGGVVQQKISVSNDGGLSFGGAMAIGPVSVLKYAAQSRGFFPGDYIGEAITAGRLYVVWAVSSKPPAGSTSRYHQVIYGVTLRI